MLTRNYEKPTPYNGKPTPYYGKPIRYNENANSLLRAAKVVAKLTYIVATIGGHITARLLPIVRFMTKQNFIWSKALIMPLTM